MISQAVMRQDRDHGIMIVVVIVIVESIDFNSLYAVRVSPIMVRETARK